MVLGRRPYPTDDRPAAVQHILILGAQTADVGQSDLGDKLTWTVLTDPQGNEFRTLGPR